MIHSLTVFLFLVLLCLVTCEDKQSIRLLKKDLDWAPVDKVLTNAIADKAFPGAVAAVFDKTGQLYMKAHGFFTYDKKTPMTLNTLFDMASVTKVIATTTATARLYQQGFIGLHNRISEIFPAFAAAGKANITVLNLLLHNSGFPPDPVPGFWSKSFGCPGSSDYHPSMSFTCLDKLFDGIMKQTLSHPIGQVYVYSDLSMMTMHLVIGHVVRAHRLVSDNDLLKGCPAHLDRGSELCYYEAYVRKHVVEDASMDSSIVKFILNDDEKSNAAPAWKDNSYRHELIQGVVSDPNAYVHGGICGHAGLFGTVPEISKLLRLILFRQDPSYLNDATITKFTTVYNTSQSSRALGWDTNSDGYGSCGSLSPRTYLHLGYTGTQVCSDPDRQLITMLFTNRVFPDPANIKIRDVRKQFNDAVRYVVDASSLDESISKASGSHNHPEQKSSNPDFVNSLTKLLSQALAF